jgi:hypothetical protein
MKTTNFDVYLDSQLRVPAFVGRFAEAGVARDAALKAPVPRQKVVPKHNFYGAQSNARAQRQPLNKAIA